MSRKSKIINGTIIILSVILMMGYVLLVDGLDNILTVLSSANPIWIFFGIGCMLLYWFCEGTVLNRAVGFFGPKMTARQSAKTCMIGQFFNCITPSSSGGQPMQAYYMYRIGISVGSSSSALMIRFITYQIALTIFSTMVLILKYQEFAANIQGFQYLILFGFTINAIVTVMLLLIGFYQKIALVMMHSLMRFLAFIRIVKHLDRQLAVVDREVEKFHQGFLAIKTHKAILVQMFGFTFLQLLAFFSVPVMIAASFGVSLTPNLIFTMIAGAACVQMSSAFIPLPGATGGAELSFYMLFGTVFPSHQINIAILLWRLLTFYLPILVGLVFSRDVFGSKKMPSLPEDSDGEENLFADDNGM